MKKIFFTLTGLFMIIISVAQVQTQVNSELKGLINQSFSFFPKVKEAQNSVSTAHEKLNIAQTNLPTVDGNLGYEYVQPKITIPFPVNGETKDVQFFPVNSVNANVSGNYLLFDFGRLKANVEKSKTDLLYAQHNVEYVKTQLANQVAVIYYSLIYIQKGIIIEDSALGYLNENKRVIESKLKNGDAIKIDLLNVQASINNEENRKLDLQNALQKQFNLLAYTTGITTSTGNSFDFEIGLRDALSALTEAQTNNLEYVLAKDRIQQAKGDLNIAGFYNRPSVGVGANMGFKNGFVPNVNEIRFNYAAGLSVKIPIYDAGKTKRQIKLDETIVRQNQLALQTLDDTYKKDIQQALTDVNSNMARIKNTDGQIEVARAAQDLAASRYKNGVGTNLEITNASTNVQKAEFTRLQYEYQLCLAKLELARLMGYQYW